MLRVVWKKATWAKSQEGKQNKQHGTECQQFLLNETYHHTTQLQKSQSPKGCPDTAE